MHGIPTKMHCGEHLFRRVRAVCQEFADDPHVVYCLRRLVWLLDWPGAGRRCHGRELEDLLANGKLTVDLSLGQAEIRDVATRWSVNLDKTQSCEREDLQETDVMDRVVELIRQPLFTTWGIEL